MNEQGKSPATHKPTLEEVQRQFEITREKIRQIEEHARQRKPPADDEPGGGAPASRA